jgi:hypothetical protein
MRALMFLAMGALVSHDVVVVAARSGAAAVAGEHLGAGPAVELHEVAFGAAVV